MIKVDDQSWWSILLIRSHSTHCGGPTQGGRWHTSDGDEDDADDNWDDGDDDGGGGGEDDEDDDHTGFDLGD